MIIDTQIGAGLSEEAGPSELTAYPELTAAWTATASQALTSSRAATPEIESCRNSANSSKSGTTKMQVKF